MMLSLLDDDICRAFDEFSTPSTLRFFAFADVIDAFAATARVSLMLPP